eukprot:12826381-Ditylum_brightwellii.AAC.1
MAGIADINTVLQQCGIPFGLLGGDSDITKMVKRLSGRSAANRRVLLGTIAIKHLQALVYWVKDKRKGGQPLVAADFNTAAIAAASADKTVRKELKAKVVLDISKLGEV